MVISGTIKPVIMTVNTQGNPIQLHEKFSRKHEKYNSFTSHAVPLQNSLSKSTMLARSVDRFKIGIDSYLSWYTTYETSQGKS